MSDEQYPMTIPSDLPFWRVVLKYEAPGGVTGEVALPENTDEGDALAFYETIKARDALAQELVARPGATVTDIKLLRFRPVVVTDDVTPAVHLPQEVTG